MENSFDLTDGTNVIGAKIIFEGQTKDGFKGFSVRFDEHGTKESDEFGPVYIEFHNGELRVHIWSDINEQNMTHTISLDGAKHSERHCDGNFVSIEECKEVGQHLTSCDDDGYCNFCGEQYEEFTVGDKVNWTNGLSSQLGTIVDIEQLGDSYIYIVRLHSGSTIKSLENELSLI